MIDIILKKLAKKLDQQCVPYMIIGGQAVLLYGNARLTRDIDITLGLDTDQLEKIRTVCRELKLKIAVADPEKFCRQTHVLPAEDTKTNMRVDFIFSFTDYERQAMRRAKIVKMAGYPVMFASREDLIIHKVFAGRAIDDEDVRNILVKHKGEVSLAYIRKWLKEFSSLPGKEDMLGKFNRMV